MAMNWVEELETEVLKRGGVWTGKQAMDYLHSIGFQCTVERARLCMRKIAAKPDSPVSPRRSSA